MAKRKNRQPKEQETVETPAVETTTETETEAVSDPVTENNTDAPLGDLVESETQDNTNDEQDIVVPDAEEETTEEPKDKEIITGVTEEAATVAAMLTKDDIAKLLKDPSLTVDEKLQRIMEKGVPVFKSLVSKLIGYREAMSSTGITDPKFGASKQYDLLMTLKSALSDPDYNSFKVKFDIINLAVMNYQDAFSTPALCRFDAYWTWNKKDMQTLHNLAIVINTLADLSKRKENIKKVNLTKALDKNTTSLTDGVIANIQKYYAV